MGSIVEQLNWALRDFSLDGVPSSGLNEVDKAAVRGVGPLIEAAIGNAGLGALVTVTKATRALLDADLAHAADVVALVYADPVDANNDLYIKTGASGSGGWTNTQALHEAIAGLAQPYSDAAAASAASAAAFDAELGGMAAQVTFGDGDLELYPAGHVVTLDPDGRIVEHYRRLGPSEMELWDDPLVIVDGGGGLVARTSGDAIRRNLSRVDMELWSDARVIVDAWGGIADRSDPYIDPVDAFDPAASSEVSAFYPAATIAGIGHSMIALGQAEAVADWLTTGGHIVSSRNFGRSGNTSRGIAARLNAIYPHLAPRLPLYLPAGGSIPASGPVTLLSDYAAIDAGPWESYGGIIPTIAGAPGYFCGIAGTFSLDGTSGMRFTRGSAGSAQVVSGPQPIVLDVLDGGDSPTGGHIANYREAVWMIWIGRNSLESHEDNLAYLRCLVRHLTSLNKAWVVLPDFPRSAETAGTAARATLDAWNARLKSEFGDNYCFDPYTGQDLLDWAIAAGPNASDRADGIISREWRTDDLHLNATGQAAIAPFIGSFLLRRGFVRV